MGECVLGIELLGDQNRPEPIHFRLRFPGGDVDVVRTTEEDGAAYWIHLRVNHPDDGWDEGERPFAKIVRARVERVGTDADRASEAIFTDGTYHVALRVEPRYRKAKAKKRGAQSSPPKERSLPEPSDDASLGHARAGGSLIEPADIGT